MPENSKKDVWDRFGAISTFLSTVVIAALGLYFTHSYNERQGARDFQAQIHQTRVLEMQTVEKFIPHLSGDEETKKIALLAITSLGSPEFATKFAQLSPSEGTEAAADQIMRTATPAGQDKVPEAVVSSPTREREGWAYVGHYVDSSGRWKTRYFDINEAIQPASLVGQRLTVRAQTGALNVREGMPNLGGSFKPVIGALKPGSQVEIVEVKEWLSSGYIWAKIHYGT
ncbi:SH3 domain-containing protein [Motiliproteus sp. SC1-56]|uniref:SH3 domain-containing protein n=1 Tax=Motiliproteus sp. SC1-56 TaxID=2799565 RepID=UPI001A907C74|nr:SH3 domain-containing protein [Motiliproteus sp. SC1-56]